MFLPPKNSNNQPDKDKQGGADKPPGQTPPTPPQSPMGRYALLFMIGVLVVWSLIRFTDMMGSTQTGTIIQLPYSTFYDLVTDGRVTEVVINADSVRGKFNEAISFTADGTPILEGEAGVAASTATGFVTTLLPIIDMDLPEILRSHNVNIIGQTNEINPIVGFLLNWAPLLLLVGLLIWMTRRTQRQMGGVFGFGRTQAREYNTERPQITFKDVAGQEAAKSELVEIVDFLKEPDKYIALGARIPRGVLLIGPPGTGKTLLARAVAGEASVAFFSIAASEFVEMFVGVGASRVRDLFSKAKAASPSIVFIDEVDAVGRQRGAGLGGGNDEREQTLNQMLAEMDGFDQTASVIVMAATNRPDVLDPALLRPGRFDRQVTVALPDRHGRLDILKVHTRGKPLDKEVDLESLSKATIGFSGADIANLANEAALTAARKSRKRIMQSDFLDAFDRIVLGTQSPPLSNEKERRIVAYHEAGHAMVSALTPGADPVFKVTIVPRGQALGVTAILPEDDRRNFSRSEFITRMLVLLGGRAAEEVKFGEITSGASSDLRRVTQIARQMVSQLGMSDKLGPVNFGDDERQPFLGYAISQGRSYSEETAAKIDAEVHRIIEDAYDQTVALLRANVDKLDILADDLMVNEIVGRERVLEIAGTLAEKQSEDETTSQSEIDLSHTEE